MSVPFSRTLRSLREDRPRSSLLCLGAATLALLAWAGWGGAARLTVYESSANARTVVERAVHMVAAETQGRIVEVLVRLGDEVDSGTEMFRVDASADELLLRERRAGAESLSREIEAVRAQLDGLAAALAQAERTNATAQEEGRAILRERELVRSLTAEELERQQALRDLGIASESELAHARSDAERGAAAVETEELTRRRVQAERSGSLLDRRARLDELEREQVRLEGARRMALAEIERLEARVAACTLRAPTRGRVVELPRSSRPGGWARPGSALATLVSSGVLSVEAEFPAARAVGRIHPGQPAEMRLDGFPWARFGTLPLIVERVGSEPTNGLVTVELSVRTLSAEDPLELVPGHGMPGVVEVALERISPAELLLRSVGGGMGG